MESAYVEIKVGMIFTHDDEAWECTEINACSSLSRSRTTRHVTLTARDGTTRSFTATKNRMLHLSSTADVRPIEATA